MPGSSVPVRGGGSGKIPNIWYTFQTTVLNKTICYTKIAKLFPVDHLFCWINLIYIYIYIYSKRRGRKFSSERLFYSRSNVHVHFKNVFIQIYFKYSLSHFQNVTTDGFNYSLFEVSKYSLYPLSMSIRASRWGMSKASQRDCTWDPEKVKQYIVGVHVGPWEG